MKRFVYINDDDSSNDLYCDNRLSNRKYTILNFLPKNLWEQFSRFMNQYFLLIACLQLWSLITPVNPASTWGPLIFIFAVSASKEAWDDYNRYLSDKKANEKEVWVVRRGVKKHIQAQDIHVGNIVWLRENDEVPCDLVLLGTSDPQGVCYVETANYTCCLHGIDSDLLHKIKGVIECPNPDNDIRKFDANLRLFPPFIDTDMCPITIKNTKLLVTFHTSTFTGNETKLGMSRGLPEPKLTAVDAMIDKLTGAIFVFQIVVVIVLGTAGNVWRDTEARKQWYVLYPDEAPWYEFLVIPLRFELLCSIMIPISIKVSLDLMKSLYAKFIDWDQEMVDHENWNTFTCFKNVSQFCNHRKFKFPFYCFSDVALLSSISSGSDDAIRFLTIMAICNTVIPVQSKNGAISYKAQSQDEDALVHAAAQLNMIYMRKNGNFLGRDQILTLQVSYELLEVLEFTSDRKRMSVVVKDTQSGKIILFSKGADEAMLPCASSGSILGLFYLVL
ncbi:unnamed protein product [Rhodiola kirilowii]